ncbi:MAG: hypothetical protein WCH60_13695, partial [Burkholderiales bacterium]
LGGMLSYAVQLPKLSGYRSAATTIAAAHIDRMRANVTGFSAGNYDMALTTYNHTLPANTACAYPTCSASDIATLDIFETNVALRHSLPGGSAEAGVGAGMQVKCNAPCSNREGNLWVIWDEPSTTAVKSDVIWDASSEECPTGLPTAAAGIPRRCVLMRFKL